MFNDTKKTIKDNIKINVSIKGMIDDAKQSGLNQEKYKVGPSVSKDISINEFTNRYKNLSRSLYASFFCIITTLIIGIVNLDLITGIISLLCIVIFAMFSVKYSFIAWRSRFIFKNWELRFDPNEFTIREFFDDVIINPLEFFPIKLKGDNQK